MNKMSGFEVIQELANDFKKEKGFDRLFSSFHQKYKGHGRLKKNITAGIKLPTIEERKAIGGYIGQVYLKQKPIRVTVNQFEKAIKGTKYKDLVVEGFMENLLEAYYGEKLVTNRQVKDEFRYKRDVFFNGYLSNKNSDLMHSLIDWIQEKENESNRFYATYNSNFEQLAQTMNYLSRLFRDFPLKEATYLPIIASRITRNPHAFDHNTFEGKLLVYALQVLKEISTGVPKAKDLNAEEITELFFEFNILRDDLANYATLFNIEGYNQDGSENMLLKATSDHKMAINLPLREVMKLAAVNAKGGKLFMLENSSVASYLMTKAIEGHNDISILSGNGMLRVATLKFLDVFVQGGGIVYYAGDYDPEGLGIAQRLINRYGDNLKLWNYSKDSYSYSLSDQEIPSDRITQLERIESGELADIKNAMAITRRAGYQENVLDGLVEFLSN